jgi:cytochrome c-type biogenesis protein CcmH/NrfG
MKQETILVVVVTLVAGVIIGWMVANQGGKSAPASAPMAPPQAGAPAGAGANVQQRINELKAVVASDPKNRNAWVALGNDYFDSDRPMDAVEAYSKALELGGNDPNVLTDQGVMFRRLGWFDRAVDNFAKANKVDPKHSVSLFNLGIVYRYDLQDMPKAKAAWEQFLAVNPNGNGSDRVRQELELLNTNPEAPKR